MLPLLRPSETREANQGRRDPAGLDLQEVGVVHEVPNHVVHLVRLLRIVRNDVVQLRASPMHRIGRRDPGPLAQVVLRKVRKEASDVVHCGSLFHAGQVGNPEIVVCLAAPPRCSDSTSSCVAVSTTLGRSTNMWLVPSTMVVNRVIAGEWRRRRRKAP